METTSSPLDIGTALKTARYERTLAGVFQSLPEGAFATWIAMRRQELSVWLEAYSSSFLDRARQTHGTKGITLKQEHTRRVVEEITDIAADLRLAGPDVDLARRIALLHDVGRFSQWARYGTFVDKKSVDHAGLALEVIEAHDLTSGLPEEDAQILTTAVFWHNKRRIPEALPQRAALFARMIRDADKLDIYRILLDPGSGLDKVEDSSFGVAQGQVGPSTEAILADINTNRSSDFTLARCALDVVLLRLSWVFDLSFPSTMRRVLERGIIPKLCRQLPPTARFDALAAQVEDAVSESLLQSEESARARTG